MQPDVIWLPDGKSSIINRFFQMLSALLFLCTGMILLSYPWISQHFFEQRANSIVQIYEAEAEQTDEDEKSQLLEMARAYNTRLYQNQIVLTDPFLLQKSANEEYEESDYSSILNLGEMGLMGFLDIPKIDVCLPIYHGTSSDVLQQGVGHLEGSSLPVGGKNTHAVLSGHTGMNSAKLLTDLVELECGDYFFLKILDDTLAYEVFDINVVLPEDTSKLQVRNQEDLVTLVTCTPYGVNSHRLLVSGRRMEYTEEPYEKDTAVPLSAENSLWMSSYRKAVFIGLGIVFLFAAAGYVRCKLI